MAWTLAEMRAFVLAQTDLDATDLPNSVLDIYIQEGVDRVYYAEQRWPLYEDSWTFNTVAGTTDYTLATIDAGIRFVAAVRGEDNELKWIGRDDHDEAAHLDESRRSKPRYWSEWDGQLRLLPNPDAVYSMTVRGYRHMTDWYGDGTTDTVEPDIPEDLHRAAAMWAIGLAYLKEEDAGLSTLYVDHFTDQLDKFSKRIVRTPPSSPLVLNKGNRGLNRSHITGAAGKYDWE